MKAELRRKQILEVSKRVFSARGGYYETHVEEVIREAKIGKGTFYQYFRNKEDLFIALLELFLDEWEAYVSQDISSFESDNSQYAIRTLVEKTLEFFFDNEPICKVYLSGGLGFGPVFEPYMQEFEQRLLRYVLVILEHGVRWGQIRPDLDLELVANVNLGALLRVAYYKFVLKRAGTKRSDLPKIADGLYEIALQGIATPL